MAEAVLRPRALQISDPWECVPAFSSGTRALPQPPRSPGGGKGSGGSVQPADYAQSFIAALHEKRRTHEPHPQHNH